MNQQRNTGTEVGNSMIKAKDVYRGIQKKLKDSNEVLYNQYEVMDAINEGIRYLNQLYAIRNSDFLENLVTFDQDELNADIDLYNQNLPAGETPKEHINLALGGVELPEDYLTMVSIVISGENYHMSPVPAVETLRHPNTYKIVGNRLYSGSACDMLYKRFITQVKNIDTDTIDLPLSYFDLLVKVGVMILTNSADSDVLLQTVTETCNQITPRRRYANVKVRMPWKV